LHGIMSFPYPPPALLVFAPLSALPFGVAFVVWVVGTGAFYLRSVRRIASLPYSLALPSNIPNALIGQNGFLFTGLFVSGTGMLYARPVVAGLILGCFAVKPQLGFLLPVALVAGGEWRALVAAAFSAVALFIAGLIAFGLASYEAFLQILPHYAEFMSKSGWQWNELASVFAFCRYFGFAQPMALACQAFSAGAAAILTWRAWSSESNTRVPVLATATMLVSPYLFTYDTLFLAVPFAWFLRRGERYISAFIWLCCFLPVLAYSQYYKGPNTAPIAALVTLWALSRHQKWDCQKNEEHALGQIEDKLSDPLGAGRDRGRSRY
jgi:alpha-1,2-mannosyltransferase